MPFVYPHVALMPDPASDRVHVTWFIHHVTVVVLLENLRRLDPALADRITGWLDDMFTDGYAGELLYQWRRQSAAGQPLSPISPGGESS